MKSLKRSKDIKVANSLTASNNVRIGNSIGLPSGKAYSCPGATSICEKICYAGRLERMRPSVRDVMMHNWELLKDADLNTIEGLLVDMLIDFEKECDKWEAPKAFRIHWDGDFFNDVYTQAWANTIKRFPDIRFWSYTRVPAAAAVFNELKLSNLAIYFSADLENINIARESGLPIAMLADTFEEAKSYLPRAAMCPEQRKQIPMAGACIACNICVKGKVDMTFSITKR